MEMTNEKKEQPALSDVEQHHVKRYRIAAHAMQSGVKFNAELAQGGMSSDQTPKMLRTGINSALADQAGLANLLMAKGVFTREEYLRAMADAMEEEARRYEAMLSGMTGGKVVLDWVDR